MVSLGPLDRTISLEAPGADVDDGHAVIPGALAVISGGANLPATYRPAPGSERFAAGATAATVPSAFIIRWSPDVAGVDPTHVLKDEDGRAFNIVSVNELGRRDGLEILAVRKADQ